MIIYHCENSTNTVCLKKNDYDDQGKHDSNLLWDINTAFRNICDCSEGHTIVWSCGRTYKHFGTGIL